MRKSEANTHNARGGCSEDKTPRKEGVFLPGATLGILGSGQLGRMSAMAAKTLGYRVVVYDETRDGPAVSCADLAIIARFDDPVALERFANEVDVVTVEFENIPLSVLEFLEKRKPVRPSSSVVHICQDRVQEKRFLLSIRSPVPSHHFGRGTWTGAHGTGATLDPQDGCTRLRWQGADQTGSGR